MNSEEITILVLSSRSWSDMVVKKLDLSALYNVVLLKEPQDLVEERVKEIDPDWVFVPHWSHILPGWLWKNYETVVFHITDVPFGRGGSPLQNLIKLKKTDSVVTALGCTDKIDAGPVYLKRPISLMGSAEEIFIRANEIAAMMISEIVREKIVPSEQIGAVVEFKRRKPSESSILECTQGDIESWHDHIRMLDAEGYPHAFLEFHGMRITFRRASRRINGIHADVTIEPIEYDEKSLREK